MLSLVNKLLDLLLSVIPSSKNTSNQPKNDPQTLPLDTNEGKVEESVVAIGLDAYFADSKTGDDRRHTYAEDLTNEILQNAEETLKRTNALLADMGIISCTVNSGWRPPSVNMAVGGSKNSAHCTGQAIDLTDKTGAIKKQIMDKLSLLEKHDLYMEDSSATPTWCHLQTRKTASGRRVFKP